MSRPAQSNFALLSQLTVLVLCAVAIAWGSFCIYWTLYPGPCGDNGGPGLLVIEACVLDVPIGLLALGVGLWVKRGSPRLRHCSIAGSLVTLALPALAVYLLTRRHCP